MFFYKPARKTYKLNANNQLTLEMATENQLKAYYTIVGTP